MRILFLLGAVVAVAAIGLAVYVRVAPSDPARWHEMPAAITNRDLESGAMRVVGAGENGLARLDAVIRSTPRTRVLAGSVEDGMVTYVTRTPVMGFPDYTTVRAAGPQIEIFGRSRFGRSDLGVNARRIDGWLRLFAERG